MKKVLPFLIGPAQIAYVSGTFLGESGRLIADIIDTCRGRSRTASTSKMELFVITVNGWKPLTIVTRSSILDVAAVLDPLLTCNLE